MVREKAGQHLKHDSILLRDVFCILGLPFDVVNLSEARTIVTTAIDKKQRCFLTTPNLNFLVTAQSDLTFFQSVVDSGLSVADGMPIIWVAKLLGTPIAERVAGSDLFEEISRQLGQDKKISVFFFGGQEGIAEQACEKLNKSSHAMTCTSSYNPGFVSIDEMSSPEIIHYINEANPDFLVVSLGAGKGQAWIQKNRDQLNARVISHLGAVVNFVAGNVERAPVTWQRGGMEWVWRITQEPILWKRYFFDGLTFLKLLALKAVPLAFYDRKLKRSKAFKAPMNINHEKSENNIITLTGSVHHAVLEPVKCCFAEVLGHDLGDVTMDCSGLEYIDGAFIGTLMLFQRYLKEQNRTLYLQKVPKRIRRIIKLNNVADYFQIKL